MWPVVVLSATVSIVLAGDLSGILNDGGLQYEVMESSMDMSWFPSDVTVPDGDAGGWGRDGSQRRLQQSSHGSARQLTEKETEVQVILATFKEEADKDLSTHDHLYISGLSSMILSKADAERLFPELETYWDGRHCYKVNLYRPKSLDNFYSYFKFLRCMSGGLKIVFDLGKSFFRLKYSNNLRSDSLRDKCIASLRDIVGVINEQPRAKTSLYIPAHLDNPTFILHCAYLVAYFYRSWSGALPSFSREENHHPGNVPNSESNLENALRMAAVLTRYNGNIKNQYTILKHLYDSLATAIGHPIINADNASVIDN